jgi:hypothetical protein
MAKEKYLDKGKQDMMKVFQGLSEDLGIPFSKVVEILSKPSKVKVLSDEMFRAMDMQRKMKQSAQFWLRDQATPGWAKAVRMVPRLFFLDKIFGHGTVGMITHAGLNVFDPAAWKTYFPSFLRQYKIAFSSAKHEIWVQEQIRKPGFNMWKRAGLKCDPFTYPDDYQNATIKTFMGKMNLLVGNYGFDALKDFRLNRANQIWDSLSADMQMKNGHVNYELAKVIADGVNHATGIVHQPFKEWAAYTFFAPRLEASRWAFMIGDPGRAAATFKGWKNATPEERFFAMSELKQKARIAGTYFSLLALNQAYLSMTGAKEKLNLNNPRRSDFLAFKVAGHDVGVISPLLGIVRLFANLKHDATGDRSKFENLSSRQDEVMDTLGKYARGKLSPMAQFGADIAFKKDAQQQPVPWSTDPLHKGEKKLDYKTYLTTTFSPIPWEEAIKEVWHDQGMPEEQQNIWLKALTVGVAAGGTGVRIAPDYPEVAPKTEAPKNPFKIKGIPNLDKPRKQFSMGDIVPRGGKNYQVVGHDTDGEPLVEQV